MRQPRPDLDRLQRDAFGYFWNAASPANGLVPDSTRPGAPCSIAAVGMSLACHAVAAERGWVGRAAAVERVRTTLRTFHRGQDGPRGLGHRGFFYHYLDMATGLRARRCEVSTIDTAILLAGALTAAAYFDADDPREAEVRALADALYRAADWRWALDHGRAVRHGWRPERGFLRYRWRGYNEALLVYVLGLGSPTRPLPAASYAAWTETYRWRRIYGIDHLHAGPLFVHQLPHAWIDLRGIRDAFMRERGIDYFENTRRVVEIQRRYAERNPRGFAGYGYRSWGVSASDGPGPTVRAVGGRRRRFFDYTARGVPFGPDDGTLAPWAVLASLPFAPDPVGETIEHLLETRPEIVGERGLVRGFNPTFSEGDRGWVSTSHYGIDQGPVVLLVENAASGLPWRLSRRIPYVRAGLERAGFRGGWLGSGTDAPGPASR